VQKTIAFCGLNESISIHASICAISVSAIIPHPEFTGDEGPLACASAARFVEYPGRQYGLALIGATLSQNDREVYSRNLNRALLLLIGAVVWRHRRCETHGARSITNYVAGNCPANVPNISSAIIKSLGGSYVEGKNNNAANCSSNDSKSNVRRFGKCFGIPNS
jgi:hypothetical protein